MQQDDIEIEVSLFEIPLEVAKILFGNLAAPMQYLLVVEVNPKPQTVNQAIRDLTARLPVSWQSG